MGKKLGFKSGDKFTALLAYTRDSGVHVINAPKEILRRIALSVTTPFEWNTREMFWDASDLKPGSVYKATIEVRVGDREYLTFNIKELTPVLTPGTDEWVLKI